ncbi:carbohydrate esterase family 10 protein [Ceratobasidium sp. AG-Ba]|nr:carbohydrate esterase family 10 protein [Ceratobasidium sp. AG-Ba]
MAFFATLLIHACLVLNQVLYTSASVINAKRDTPAKASGNGTTYFGTREGDVDVFLGIPYAQPPVGNLRFRKPRPPIPGKTVNATSFAPRCMQFVVSNTTSEDCLTLNIWRPRKSKKPMPVMIWFYGGAFFLGEAQTYPGGGLVNKSIAVDQPTIYVSFNHRLGIYGFPIGKEASAHGSRNLALYDQRAAIEWVHSHIQYFGGDPNKITLFGGSSGGIAVSYQMMFRNGQIGGAFRAAIMQSGSPTSYRSLPQDTPARQATYDEITAATGCNKAKDSFECLRALDIDKLQEAHVATYKLPTELVAFYVNFPATYGPVVHPDDDFLPEPASELVKGGRYANIPMISGSVVDEGTWFVNNPSTPAEITEFLAADLTASAFNMNSSMTDPLLAFYPDDISAGSPYGTGNETFGRAKEFKRIASLVGDLAFNAPRRAFIQQAAARRQKIWQRSYLFTQQSPSAPPGWGVYHTLETTYILGAPPANATAGDYQVSNYIMEYWLNFVHFLNPHPMDSKLPGMLNVLPKMTFDDKLWVLAWPPYDSARTLLQIHADNYTLIPDDYREDVNSFIMGKSSLLL